MEAYATRSFPLRFKSTKAGRKVSESTLSADRTLKERSRIWSNLKCELRCFGPTALCLRVRVSACVGMSFWCAYEWVNVCPVCYRECCKPLLHLMQGDSPDGVARNVQFLKRRQAGQIFQLHSKISWITWYPLIKHNILVSGNIQVSEVHKFLQMLRLYCVNWRLPRRYSYRWMYIYQVVRSYGMRPALIASSGRSAPQASN